MGNHCEKAQTISLSLWHLQALGQGSHLLPRARIQVHQTQGTCYHVNVCGPGQHVLKQLGRHQGGPHHQEGVLISSLLWGNTFGHPWQPVPMHGLGNLCKGEWGPLVYHRWFSSCNSHGAIRITICLLVLFC